MTNIYKIKNNNLIVEIADRAGEVYSFKKIDDDYNYVWSGDETYWGGRNPILFPQVSSTDNKTVLINGKFYPMGNHGFARHSTFSLKEIKDDELSLVLNENSETLSQYPFKFELQVNYKLESNKMFITYTIKNNSDIDMPYGFGLHPAFNCPLDYKDTKVVFNNAEDNIGNELVISKELFEKTSTVVIDNPKSTKATLHSNNKKISVSLDGFKIFAVWSKGPFVCLEPWICENDKDHNIEMKDRKDYKVLKPKEEAKYLYTWEIE